MNFTPKQITRMAMEAEIGDSHGYIIRNELPNLTRFADLAAEAAIKSAPDYKIGYADGAAAEREACAKVCEVKAAEWADGETAGRWQTELAAAIRARELQ